MNRYTTHGMHHPFHRTPYTGDLPNETWRDIDDWPGYRISNLGRVLSSNDGSPKLRRPVPRKHGYLSIALRRRNRLGNPVTRSFYVHRLVALAFLPNPEGLPEVDHIDANPANNEVSNLRWISHRGNLQAAIERRDGHWCAGRAFESRRTRVRAKFESGETKEFPAIWIAAEEVYGSRKAGGNICNAADTGVAFKGVRWERV